MQQFWLAFTYVHGVGPIRLRHLRSQFTTLENAWNASSHDLLAAGLPQASVDHHAKLRQELKPERLLEQVAKLHAWVITWEDEQYPPLLREINDAPPVLYGRGTLYPEDQRSLAVVGTRRASIYGKEMTQRLVSGLAAQEITIVSGLAHGIDTYAHQAAIEAGGRTIAVMGCGIDQLYPSDQKVLAAKIVEQGALITEFPPGTKPERGNFPARNRIISGLTLGTLVIEAPDRSGSLMTANLAGEQNRDVFAVPGNATSPNSLGTNRLIQDGAKLVLTMDDILKELNLTQRQLETQRAVQAAAPATPLEAQILQLVTVEPLHVDEVCRRCALSIQEINATMVLMELKGLIIQVAPLTYSVLVDI